MSYDFTISQSCPHCGQWFTAKVIIDQEFADLAAMTRHEESLATSLIARLIDQVRTHMSHYQPQKK